MYTMHPIHTHCPFITGKCARHWSPIHQYWCTQHSTLNYQHCTLMHLFPAQSTQHTPKCSKYCTQQTNNTALNKVRHTAQYCCRISFIYWGLYCTHCLFVLHTENCTPPYNATNRILVFRYVSVFLSELWITMSLNTLPGRTKQELSTSLAGDC